MALDIIPSLIPQELKVNQDQLQLETILHVRQLRPPGEKLWLKMKSLNSLEVLDL